MSLTTGGHGAAGHSSVDVKDDDGSRAGTVRDDAGSLGGYLNLTHTSSGLWADIVAQGTRHSMKASSDNNDFRARGWGWLGSLETGLPFSITDNLMLEPQLQYTWQGLSLDDGQDNRAEMSPEAAGIAACLMTYSHHACRTECYAMTVHYYRLRDYALQHPECSAISRWQPGFLLCRTWSALTRHNHITPVFTFIFCLQRYPTMKIITRGEAMRIHRQHPASRLFPFCTGKYRWHGSAEAYTGREVQDIPGVLAVFAERRKDSFGPYVRLMSVTLN